MAYPKTSLTALLARLPRAASADWPERTPAA
jgi:hypothetical protein